MSPATAFVISDRSKAERRNLAKNKVHAWSLARCFDFPIRLRSGLRLRFAQHDKCASPLWPIQGRYASDAVFFSFTETPSLRALFAEQQFRVVDPHHEEGAVGVAFFM